MSLRWFIFAFCFLISSFLSCKNNDQLFKPVTYTNINVINAGADTLNFYLNGTRQNNTSSLFPGGQSFYLPEPAGAQNYQFKKAGTPKVLFSLPLTLQDSVNYSLYVTGESAAQSFYTKDFLDPTGLDSVTSKVRLFNGSPDAGTLSISIGDTVKFSDSVFGSTSDFQLVGSGIKIVKIYQTGVTTPRLDTVTLQPNYIYTLFTRGQINGKGSAAFNLSQVINYQQN